MPPLQLSRARDDFEAGPRPGRPVDLTLVSDTWVNFDAASKGIHHLEIADRDGRLMIRTWGSGEPAPLDWGEAEADPFTDGVTLHEAVAFRTSYDLGFARVMLACYLNKRLLVVDAYTVFHDESGRSPYFQRDHFYIP